MQDRALFLYNISKGTILFYYSYPLQGQNKQNDIYVHY